MSHRPPARPPADRWVKTGRRQQRTPIQSQQARALALWSCSESQGSASLPLQNQTSPKVTSLIDEALLFLQLAQLAATVKFPPAADGLRYAFHFA